MPVTDNNVAMLKAQLSGDRDEYGRQVRRFDSTVDSAPYVFLINCAMFEAATRRFGAGSTSAEVVAFVDGIRSRTDEAAELDPVVAGRVLLTAIADGTVTGLDPQAVRAAQLYLLAALVVDAQLEGEELDALLARARELADGQLARAIQRKSGASG